MEEKAYYTALGEEYKLNWRSSVCYTMVENSLRVVVSIATILISTGYYLYKRLSRKTVVVNTVWVIGASSGIGKGNQYHIVLI